MRRTVDFRKWQRVAGLMAGSVALLTAAWLLLQPYPTQAETPATWLDTVDTPQTLLPPQVYTVYLPIALRPSDIPSSRVTGTLDGHYTFVSIGATITDTFHVVSSSITVEWTPVSSGTIAQAGLVNPLGRPSLNECIHSCVVMVWSLPISATHRRVLSGTLTFPGLATVTSGRTGLTPDQVPVEVRQTQWASPPLDGLSPVQVLAYWQQTRPGWTTYFGEQYGCRTSTLHIPDGALNVEGNRVGLMVCPGAAHSPDLWQHTPDSNYVYYLHQLLTVSPAASCAPPQIELWLEAEG